MNNENSNFKLLQKIRIIISIIITSAISHFLNINTSLFLLNIASSLGVIFAGILLKKEKTWSYVIITHVLSFLALYFAYYILNLIISANPDYPKSDFAIYKMFQHIFLLYYFYLFFFFSSWFYWVNKNSATIEALLLAVFLTYGASGHRNYYLDAPKSLSSLAWKLSLEPQHLLIAIGFLTSAIILIYFIISNKRKIFFKENEIIEKKTSNNVFPIIVSLFFFLLMLSFSFYINYHYSKQLSRATNGVGQGSNKEGESPLGFHSSIGKTKQPAALVRLESDYKLNPDSPMLYFREGVLSTYNKKELVYDGGVFDRDTPFLREGDIYRSIEKKPKDRKLITQSIYLLVKHNQVFAIDFPHIIQTIKNPDSEKFKFTYQAISYAPTTKLNTFMFNNVGSKKWDKETLNHYLRAPGSKSIKDLNIKDLPKKIDPNKPILDEYGEDLRYLILSKKVIGENQSMTPLMKVTKIINYLSKNSIYTRSPNHKITRGGDPVAAYLFAKEKHGYCVHFAHAAAYLMRLNNIPARIATGYLTDLNNAKDGHILLLLGDRHAWPEFYIEGEGWRIIDVHPERAENEPQLIPDEKLLEELMDKIDPAEILEKPEEIKESEEKEESFFTKELNTNYLIYAFFTLIFLFLLVKIFLRFSYKFILKSKLKTHLAYISFSSLMTDLGYKREFGETKKEYSIRLFKTHKINSSLITKYSEQNAYSKNPPLLENETLDLAIKEALNSYKETHSKKSILLAFFSIRSIYSISRL